MRIHNVSPSHLCLQMIQAVLDTGRVAKCSELWWLPLGAEYAHGRGSLIPAARLTLAHLAVSSCDPDGLCLRLPAWSMYANDYSTYVLRRSSSASISALQTFALR